jgi:hypothetical protein
MVTWWSPLSGLELSYDKHYYVATAIMLFASWWYEIYPFIPGSSCSTPQQCASGKPIRLANQHEPFLGCEGCVDDECFHDVVCTVEGADDGAMEDVAIRAVDSSNSNNAHVGDFHCLMSSSSNI